MNIIGVDPATHTGIAVLRDGEAITGVRVPMRAPRKGWLAPVDEWVAALREFTPGIMVIEAQHVGRGSGCLIPSLSSGWWWAAGQEAGLDIAQRVQPSTWQAYHGIRRKSKVNKIDTKTQAIELAGRLYGPRYAVKDVADAVLIAAWAYHQDHLVLEWEARS